MERYSFRFAIGILAFVFVVSGCSTKDPETAQEFYDLASGHLRDGAYSLAIENYRELLDQHPFSDLAEESEFKIAQAHFQDRACPEAIAAFSDFQRRHPTSPHLPRVGFMIGICHERQMKNPDRDQSASQSAHAHFQSVINQYPDSPYADLSRERLHHCREALAEHELNVSRYYQRVGKEAATETRLIDLVKRYNDTDQAAEALYELGMLYSARDEADKASLAMASLIYHHPNHNLANDAESELDDLTDDRPIGDPLAVLMARSGRYRNLDDSNAEEVETTAATAAAAQSSSQPRVGFNQPTYDPIETSRPNRQY